MSSHVSSALGQVVSADTVYKWTQQAIEKSSCDHGEPWSSRIKPDFHILSENKENLGVLYVEAIKALSNIKDFCFNEILFCIIWRRNSDRWLFFLPDDCSFSGWWGLVWNRKETWGWARDDIHVVLVMSVDGPWEKWGVRKDRVDTVVRCRWKGGCRD